MKSAGQFLAGYLTPNPNATEFDTKRVIFGYFFEGVDYVDK